MRAQKHIVDEIVVVAVLEPRLDGARGVELKQLVSQIVEEGHRTIILDLADVAFIDSSALGAIVWSLKLVARGGELAICGMSDAVQTLFRLTRMDKVLRSFRSRQEALAALSVKP